MCLQSTVLSMSFETKREPVKIDSRRMMPNWTCQPTQDHNFLKTLYFLLFLSFSYRALIYIYKYAE